MSDKDQTQVSTAADAGDAGYNKALKNRHIQMIAIGGGGHLSLILVRHAVLQSVLRGPKSRAQPVSYSDRRLAGGERILKTGCGQRNNVRVTLSAR